MKYFSDAAVLGVWLTLVNMFSWVLSFDLGIGHGLRNKLTEAIAKENEGNDAKKYISSAYFVLGVITALLILACVILTNLVNWNAFFNISTAIIPKELLSTVVRIVFLGVLVNLLLHLISSILYAFQFSAIVNLLAVLQNILIIGYLYFGSSTNMAANLIRLAWVNVFAMNLPPLITTIILFSTKLKRIRPSVKHIRKSHAKDTMGLGLAFLVLQIFGIVITQNDIFITNFYSPADVVEFQTYYKLFGFVVSVFSLLMTPLWSKITKEMAEKKFSWVNNLFKIVCACVVLTSLLFFLLVPFLSFIFKIWLGEGAPVVKSNYAIVMALVAIINVSYFAWSTVSFGMNLLKPNLIILAGAAIIKIPLIYVLSSFINNWTAVAWAHIIVLLPYSILMPIIIRQYLKNKALEFS